MNHFTIVTTTLFFVLVPSAHSMQPCPVQSGCVDEASAALVAALEVITEACIAETPTKTKDYEDSLKRKMQEVDVGYIQAVKILPEYSDFLEEARLNLKKHQR